MDVMYIRHKIAGISPLLPDEELLYSQERFRAVSLTCSSFSRGLWVPPLCCGIRLCVTNRRILLSCCILPLYRQEVDLWFSGQQPEGKTESLTAVSLENGYFGRCLEIRSRDPSRHQSWFSSPDLTVRLFCKEPENIERVIREVMSASQCP